MEIVSVIINTTQELPTLENGAVRLVFPTVLTPIVRARMVPSKTENGLRSDENGYGLGILIHRQKNVYQYALVYKHHNGYTQHFAHSFLCLICCVLITSTSPLV